MQGFAKAITQALNWTFAYGYKREDGLPVMDADGLGDSSEFIEHLTRELERLPGVVRL